MNINIILVKCTNENRNSNNFKMLGINLNVEVILNVRAFNYHL